MIMEKINFENLPQAVSLLIEKVDLLTMLLETKTNNTNAISDKPMSITEAAKFVNLTVPTLYGFVSKRTIPFSKIGKRLYFTETELAAWIQSGRKKTCTEISDTPDTFLITKKSKR